LQLVPKSGKHSRDDQKKLRRGETTGSHGGKGRKSDRDLEESGGQKKAYATEAKRGKKNGTSGAEVPCRTAGGKRDPLAFTRGTQAVKKQGEARKGVL